MKSNLKICIYATLILATSASVFGQGIWEKYHTYNRAISELQAIAAAHPDICALDSIGYSSRDSLVMWALKISDNVNIEEDEPAIFFSGGVHADEILGPEIIIAFCNDIVSKFAAGDTAVIRYVNSYEIFAMPFINPEGHTVVESGDMDWRKNKEDNNHNGILDFHDGVDNNRNYDFGWNLDTDPAATTPESLMYKGPYPFSEAENRSLAAFAQKYKPLVAVDYHSPTYGRSEKVYYNWYWYPPGHGMAPDEPLMHSIGNSFAGSVINDAGDSCYEARRGLVQQGDYKTYFYGNFGTAAYVCEVSDTTIQDTSRVDGICTRNLAGMYYLLQRSGYARITGVVTDSITGLPMEAEVQVQGYTGVDINPRLTRVNTGRYDRFLAAGTYTLIFLKTGYVTKTISGVVVTNSGPTTTNVRLRTVGTPPAAPMLISPVDGSTFFDSLALNFDWSSSSGATGYVFEIGDDQNFVSRFEVDSNLTASNYRNLISLHADTFYWRVTAFNTSGFSPRSSVWHFTIQITPPPPPATPTLTSPVDGFVSSSAYLNFDWNDSPTAARYAIQIDIDSLFSAPLITDTAITVSQFANADSFANMRYFWRVKAGNSNGWSGYSPPWSFTVDVIANPGCQYVPGDVNGNDTFTGLDVVYAVAYLKGGPAPLDSCECPPGSGNTWYVSGDVNASCTFTGLDVSYMVAYLKGGPELRPCPDCPPIIFKTGSVVPNR